MSYISGDAKPKLIKKEVSKDVFRDMLKVICPNCSKIFEHEVKFTITCPYCEWKLDGIETPKGL